MENDKRGCAVTSLPIQPNRLEMEVVDRGGSDTIIGLVLASFDHDDGNVITAQLPNNFLNRFLSDLRDLSWFADQCLPDGAHNTVDDYCVTFLHRGPPWAGGELGPQPIYCFSVYQTRTYEGFHRQTMQRSLCLVTRSRRFHYFKDVLMATLSQILDLDQKRARQLKLEGGGNYYGRDPDVLAQSIQIIQETLTLLHSFNSRLQSRFMRSRTRVLSMTSGEIQVAAYGRQLMLPHSVVDAANGEFDTGECVVGDPSLQRLIQTFGSRVMLFWQALLTQRSVCIYAARASDVVSMVLALPLLVEPLFGYDRFTWPYVTLNELELLGSVAQEQPIIVGTTNPLVLEQEALFDIRADCCTGRIDFVSDGMLPRFHVSKSGLAFAQALTNKAHGQSEDWFREQFRRYTESLLSEIRNSGAPESRHTSSQLIGHHYQSVIIPALLANPLYQIWRKRETRPTPTTSPGMAVRPQPLESLSVIMDSLCGLLASTAASQPASPGPQADSETDFQSISSEEEKARYTTFAHSREASATKGLVATESRSLREAQIMQLLVQLCERVHLSVRDGLWVCDHNGMQLSLQLAHSESVSIRLQALRLLEELCQLPLAVTELLLAPVADIVELAVNDGNQNCADSGAALAASLTRAVPASVPVLLQRHRLLAGLVLLLLSGRSQASTQYDCASALLRLVVPGQSLFTPIQLSALVPLLGTADPKFFMVLCQLLDTCGTDVPALVGRSLPVLQAKTGLQTLGDDVNIHLAKEHDDAVYRASAHTERELDRQARQTQRRRAELERENGRRMRREGHVRCVSEFRPEMPLMLLDDADVHGAAAELQLDDCQPDSAIISRSARSVFVVAETVQKVIRLLPLQDACAQLQAPHGSPAPKLGHRRRTSFADALASSSTTQLWVRHAKTLTPLLTQLNELLLKDGFPYHLLAALPLRALVDTLAYLAALIQTPNSVPAAHLQGVFVSAEALFGILSCLIELRVPVVRRQLPLHSASLSHALEVSIMQDGRIRNCTLQLLPPLIDCNVALGPLLPVLALALRMTVAGPRSNHYALQLTQIMQQLASKTGVLDGIGLQVRCDVCTILEDIIAEMRLRPQRTAARPSDEHATNAASRPQRLSIAIAQGAVVSTDADDECVIAGIASVLTLLQ